jgi:hypothetical protein
MLTAGIATSQLRVTALSYGTATTMMTKGGGLPWTVMADAAATAVDLILARRAWAVVAPKETILPYRTMTLPAAAGTTTTRRHRCGVVGGRPTEEGVDIIARTMTTQRKGGTSSPERRRRGGGGHIIDGTPTRGGRGGHHRRNDNNDGYRRGHHRGGYDASPEYPLNLITSGILSLPVGSGFPSDTTNSWAAFLARESAPFFLDNITKF